VRALARVPLDELVGEITARGGELATVGPVRVVVLPQSVVIAGPDDEDISRRIASRLAANVDDEDDDSAQRRAQRRVSEGAK
jgi:hypothetical protein